MCQVIFSGAGLTSQMCPQNAADKIKNLIISVNEYGSSTGQTLLAAYSELIKVVKEGKDEAVKNNEVDVVLADGHGSRFYPKLMEYCSDNKLDQHILLPDTSGVTQKHDQINNFYTVSTLARKKKCIRLIQI